jgi:hypothetical protein
VKWYVCALTYVSQHPVARQQVSVIDGCGSICPNSDFSVCLHVHVCAFLRVLYVNSQTKSTVQLANTAQRLQKIFEQSRTTRPKLKTTPASCANERIHP